MDPEVVLASLYRILKSNATSETKAWIVAAISKTASRTTGSKTVEKLLLEFSASLDTSMRQQAFELKYLYENKELMKRLFPPDASCKNVVVSPCYYKVQWYVRMTLGAGRRAADRAVVRQRQLSLQLLLGCGKVSEGTHPPMFLRLKCKGGGERWGGSVNCNLTIKTEHTYVA